MNYDELKNQTNRGWNTWNVTNTLSYTHLPQRFTINLCFKAYGDSQGYRNNLVGQDQR